MKRVLAVSAVMSLTIALTWSASSTPFAPRTAAAADPVSVQSTLAIQGGDVPAPPGIARDGGLTGVVTNGTGSASTSQVVWAFGDTACPTSGVFPCTDNSYATGVPTLDYQNNNLDASGDPSAPLMTCPFSNPTNGRAYRCWPSGFANQSDGSTTAFADLVDVYSTTENGKQTLHIDPHGEVAYQYTYGTQTPSGSPVQVFGDNDCGWTKPFQGLGNDGNTYTFLTADPSTTAKPDCPAENDANEVRFARVPVGSELDKSKYQYYDANSGTWTSTEGDASGSWTPVHGSSFHVYGSIAWNPYLNQYLAMVGGCGIVGYDCGNQITFYTASSVEGPWTQSSASQALPECTPTNPGSGSTAPCGFGIYAFSQHPELQAGNGRVIEISYYDSATGRIKTESIVLNPDASTASDLVANLYQDLTGQQIGASEQSSLVAALESGSSLSALGDQITADEPLYYINHMMTGLIESVYDRAPQGTEVHDTFTQMISPGSSWNTVEASLFASSTFVDAHTTANTHCSRSTDFDCYIEGIYQIALGREPTANEYTLYEALAAQGWTYADFATAFMVGPNGVSDQAHQHQVAEEYQAVFGREPTTDEVQTGAALLATEPYQAPPALHTNMYDTAQGVAALAPALNP